MKLFPGQFRFATSLLLMFALLASANVRRGVVAQSKLQDEQLDYAMIGKIREEGLNRSQVMDHISWLSDVYGPRLTGSPAIKQAGDWAMKKFNEWGLANAHQESWPFGKGWSLTRFSAHMTEPQISPLIGYPKSWTPGTNGTINADVVYVPISAEADFEKYRGKLKDKAVLLQAARVVRMLDGRIVMRVEPQISKVSQSTVDLGNGVTFAHAGPGRGSARRQPGDDDAVL